MAREDTGLRRRWEDRDPQIEGEENDARAERQHNGNVDRAAEVCIERDMDPAELGMGQRENSEEVAADFQEEVRTRVAEMQDERLTGIEQRFYALPRLHPGIEWADVQAALLKDPETLRKIEAFDAKGHEMNVMGKENGEFIFVSCWTDFNKVSPDHRNIAYDEDGAFQAGLDEKRSATHIVESMGATLANEKYHDQLRGVTGVNGWAWLETDAAVRKTGRARCGSGGVDSDNARDHYDHGSFRAELRVKEA